MKRRQQIRELIEHHDVANEEEIDFFNATPGRSNKNNVCNFSNAKCAKSQKNIIPFIRNGLAFGVTNP